MKNYVDFKAFSKDVEKALAPLAKKYGLDIKPGSISYGNCNFTMKLQATRTDMDVQMIEFGQNVRYMPGFTADDYLISVNIEKKSYILIGFKPGNKYSVLLKRDDGKEYLFTSSVVLKALGR